MNAVVPTWGFLFLVAVMFFVVFLVVAAVMSSRNRGVLGALGAVIGFCFVALVGVFLLLALSWSVVRVEVAESPATLVQPETPVLPEAPAPPETPQPATEVRKVEAELAIPPDQTVIRSPVGDALAPGGTTAVEATIRSPAPRPKWMDEPQGKHATDGAYHKIASVELLRTRAECDEARPAELRKALKQYIDPFLGEEGAAELVDLPMPDIHDRIIKAEWEEHTADVLGPIVNLHTLLVFDGKTNAEIKARYQRARVAGRLTTTGVGAGLLLGLLGAVFGYLKLDTLTRGYYARRLQFAAGSAILVLAAIAAFLAKVMLGH